MTEDRKDPPDEEPESGEGVEPSTWAARRAREQAGGSKPPGDAEPSGAGEPPEPPVPPRPPSPPDSPEPPAPPRPPAPPDSPGSPSPPGPRGPFGKPLEPGFGPFGEDRPPPPPPGREVRFLEDTDEVGAAPPPDVSPKPPPGSTAGEGPAEPGEADEPEEAEADDSEEPEAEAEEEPEAEAEAPGGGDPEAQEPDEGGPDTEEVAQAATQVIPGGTATVEGDGAEDLAPEVEERQAALAAAEALGAGDGPAPALGGVPPGMVPPPGYRSVEVEGPREPRLWARFLAGSAIVVFSMALATAASILVFLSDIAEGIQPLPADAIRSLDDIDSGEPRTILVLGSDRRIGDREAGIPARADTVMLVRLDGSRGAIATLRFPRDLKVRIPGGGTDKLNAAYSIGGPGKTLVTIKELTGLDVHHLVDVNFNGFQRAVNALGCLYLDVDRRYFNTNEGRPIGQQYAEIDLMPGYQRLCGADSLDFARYRHTDNDLVRGARQQEVLRQARARISAQRVFQSQDQLINIFKRYTRSDLKGRPGQILDLMNLFVDARKQPVREVNLEVEMGPVYVTTSERAMAKARREFLGLTGTEGPRSQSAEREIERRPDTEAARRRQAQRRRQRQAERRQRSRPSLIDASGAGETQARAAAGGVNFDVFYPTRVEAGSQYTDQTRSYRIQAPNGELHRAYKLVLRTQRKGGIEYYGVMGTEWREPPILRDPSHTRKVGNRHYLVYDGNGSRPRVVAWRTERAAYWISNTLLQSLTEAEMLGIAHSSRRIRF